MDQEKIITLMKITDYNLDLLPESQRTLNGKQLEYAIIEHIKRDFGGVPGNLNVKIEDGIIITEYDPYEFSEEDDRKFRKAINLLTERNFSIGEEILLELIEDHPLNSALLYNLGMTYSEQGQFEKSLKPLLKSVELMPYYSEAFTALGFSYSGIGEKEKAIQFTKKAIQLNEKNFYALRNMAGMLGSLNRFEEAKVYTEKALEINPDEPSALYSAAITYKELGDIDKAKLFLNRIIDNGIDDRFIQYARDLLTKITSTEFKKDDLRMDAVMYLVAAMNEFKDMPLDNVRDITFEIGLKGKNGFKFGDTSIKYKIDKLNKECTGLQMVCYMYAGFKIIDPSLDVGFDLEKEYEFAKKMSESGI